MIPLNKTEFRSGIAVWLLVLTALVAGLYGGILYEERQESPYYEIAAGDSTKVAVEELTGGGLHVLEKDCLKDTVPDGVEVTAIQRDQLKYANQPETTHLVFKNTYSSPVRIQKHAIEDCSPDDYVGVAVRADYDTAINRTMTWPDDCYDVRCLE